MEGFNPITDLQQNTDQFNVPAGTSTPEIEDIRERLVDTRNKTAELVKILKKKNTLFKQDTDKIKNLNRRLYKTIPRIPAMRGVASTEFGPDLKEEDKKARLRLDFFRRFRTRSPVPTKKPLPILEGIIFLALSVFGIRGIKNIKGAENIDDLLKGSGIKIDTTKINQKKLLEILEEALKKKKIIKDTRQPIKLQPKDLNLKGLKKRGNPIINQLQADESRAMTDFALNSSRDYIKKYGSTLPNLDLASLTLRSYRSSLVAKLKNAEKLGENKLLIRSLKTEIRKVDSQIKRYEAKIQKLKNTNIPEEDIQKVKDRRNLKQEKFYKTRGEFLDDNNLVDPYKLRNETTLNFTRNMEQVNKLLDAKKISRAQADMAINQLRFNLRTTNRYIEQYGDKLYNFATKYPRYDGTQKELKNLLNDIIKDTLKKADDLPTPNLKELEGNKFLREVLRDQNFKLLDVPAKDVSSIIDGKPMSNDIASLNIDTGITNTVIILTDPPTA